MKHYIKKALYRFIALGIIIGIVFVVVLVSLNFDAYYQIFKYKFFSESQSYSNITTGTYISDDNDNAVMVQNNSINHINTSFLDEDIGMIMQDLSNYNSITDDDRIIIPKININAPLKFVVDEVRGKTLDNIESIMLEALKKGVVHYPNSALPGDTGNFVVTGHSSYYPWDNGRYKSIFALLEQINIGDDIIYFYKQKKYTYRIKNRKVVSPDKVDVLYGGDKKETTIITCVPVGTNLNRLILRGELINIK